MVVCARPWLIVNCVTDCTAHVASICAVPGPFFSRPCSHKRPLQLSFTMLFVLVILKRHAKSAYGNAMAVDGTFICRPLSI